MTQKEIELILIRQLASCLATPMSIIDAAGNLVFFNEPAEKILGLRFEETGEMTPAEWSTAWTPSDLQGKPVSPDELPLWIAVNQRRPAHDHFWIRGLDNVSRCIETVAFPIVSQGDRYLGAVTIFWERPSS